MATKKKTEIDLYRALGPGESGLAVADPIDKELFDDVDSFITDFREKNDNVDTFTPGGFQSLRDAVASRYGINGDKERLEPHRVGTLLQVLVAMANANDHVLMLSDAPLMLGMPEKQVNDLMNKEMEVGRQLRNYRTYVKNNLERRTIGGSVGAIFLLKATFEYRDNTTININQNAGGKLASVDEIMEKYGGKK